MEKNKYENKENNYLYHFVYVCLKFFFKVFAHLETRGKLPPSDGAILCSNHLSNFDPPVIATAASGRTLNFMAKKELFASPFTAFLLRKLNTFPVNRSFFDRASFRKAVNTVNSGGNLLVFPEGTRNKTGNPRLGNIRRAVSYIIYNTNKPVVPVYVRGTNKFARRGLKASVSFGEPLEFPERKMPYTREISEKICAKIRDGINAASN